MLPAISRRETAPLRQVAAAPGNEALPCSDQHCCRTNQNEHNRGRDGARLTSSPATATRRYAVSSRFCWTGGFLSTDGREFYTCGSALLNAALWQTHGWY